MRVCVEMIKSRSILTKWRDQNWTLTKRRNQLTKTGKKPSQIFSSNSELCKQKILLSSVLAELFQEESPKPEPVKPAPLKKEEIIQPVLTSVPKKPAPKKEAEPIIENKIIPKKSFYSPVVHSSPSFRSTSNVLRDLETLGTSLAGKNVPCIKRPRDDEDDFLIKSPRMTEVFTTPKRTRTKFVYNNKGNNNNNLENQENDGNQLNSGSKSLRRWNRSSSSLSNSCGKG